ncbi:MAG: hypothetical protein QNJ27_05675 [Simkaniaceae bacterium]|nr:hypothetical protein [Simkaniaceae bacterium]
MDVVIRMNFQGLGMFSDGYNQEIYEHGRKMAQAILPQIEPLIQDRLPMIHEESFPPWVDADLAE